jgi:excisionase family DNA binding protein
MQQAQLLTIRDASSFFQVSRRTLKNWCKAGHIEEVKIGRTIRIRPDSVSRLIEGQADAPRPLQAARQWVTGPEAMKLLGRR